MSAHWAKAGSSAGQSGVETVVVDPAISNEVDPRAVADPIAVPLPTAAQSGIAVLAAAAVWQGARRLWGHV
jgi:hypothetical protein